MENYKRRAEALLEFARTGKKDASLPSLVYSSSTCAFLIKDVLMFATTKHLALPLFRELSAGRRFGDSPSNLHVGVLALVRAGVEIDYV